MSAMSCPDPAAYDIRFQIVQRRDKFNGRVRITGIIKNIGRKVFKPIHNQAKAYLYEMPPGASTGGNILAQKVIGDLTAGETLSLNCERNWTSNSTSGGEFPPIYRLQILYDPDVYKNTTMGNDDCSQKNNTKVGNGSEINDMFGK